MSKAIHTPGPWQVCVDAPSLIEASIGHEDGLMRTIAQALDPIPHIGDKTVNANARLIAAAPELLDVLQVIVRQCGSRLTDVSGNDALLSCAEAVIAKATA